MKYFLSLIILLFFSTVCISESNHPYSSIVVFFLFLLLNFVMFLQNTIIYINILNNKRTLYVFLFLIYLFFTASIVNTFFGAIKLVGLYLILFSPFFIYQFLIRAGVNLSSFIKINFVTIVIFILISLNFYQGKFDAARVIASDKNVFGIIYIGGGYPLAFGLAILNTYLLEVLIDIKDRKYKLLIFLFLLISSYYIFVTKSTITLVSLAIGYFLVLFYRNSTTNKKLKFLRPLIPIFLLVILFLNLNFFIRLLSEMDNDVIYNRLLEGTTALNKGLDESDYTDYRLGRPIFSLNSFIENPLFGTGYKYGYIYKDSLPYMGGHSYILDSFANFGLLGTIPYLLFYINIFDFSNGFRWNSSKKYFFVFIFMAFLNPINVFFVNWVLFFIIPYFQNKYERV